MEKSRFIEIAPFYYALAICLFFKSQSTVAYYSDIAEHYTDPETSEVNEYCYIQKRIIFDKAVAWLSEIGAVEFLADEFGPPVYRRPDDFYSIFQQLQEDRSLPFFKASAVRNERRWLTQALAKLNETYDRLGINVDDFETPDQQWEPLPLDRDDKSLQEAIKSLDDVVEHIRIDNGYNATVPEERNYVLTSLSHASKTLKDATSTSLPYLITYIIEPLSILVRRFGGAAIGVLASSAKDSVVEFLKQHGVALLNSIFK